MKVEPQEKAAKGRQSRRGRRRKECGFTGKGSVSQLKRFFASPARVFFARQPLPPKVLVVLRPGSRVVPVRQQVAARGKAVYFLK